jgi:hypothetical protein
VTALLSLSLPMRVLVVAALFACALWLARFIAIALAEHFAARSGRSGGHLPWLVVICREGVSDVTVFTEEDEARAYFELASSQWSDSYLARAVIASRVS